MYFDLNLSGKQILVGLLIIYVLVVLLWYYWPEGLFPLYYNQIAMKNEDPTFFQYKGRDRDLLGMSREDYYIEHDLMAKNGAEPYHHNDNEAQFSNTTNYLQLNKTYRPRPSIKTTVLDQ